MRTKRFTLIEILVVISIVLTLAAMLIPGLKGGGADWRSEVGTDFYEDGIEKTYRTYSPKAFKLKEGEVVRGYTKEIEGGGAYLIRVFKAK